MADKTPTGWNNHWDMRRRQVAHQHDKTLCQHAWQHKPKDIFKWYCSICGAWSRSLRLIRSKKGELVR